MTSGGGKFSTSRVVPELIGMKEEDSLVRLKIKEAIDGKIVTIGMACITLWALFGDDLRLVAISKEADDAFYITFFICFLLFLIELIL